VEDWVGPIIAPVADSGSNRKAANSLLALSSAAVLAVYTAGYLRTRAAADRVEVQAAARRPAIPAPPSGAPPAFNAAPAAAAPVRVGTAPAAASTTKRPADRRRPRWTPAQLPAKPAAAADAPLPSRAPVESPAAVALPVPAAIATPPPAKPRYKDGTYLGWGTSRHGDIQASVVIEDGRILSATIAQCLTRYSCSVIEALPPQVAQRQSPETDYVSGATQSTNAFYYAVVDALSKAK
jgi:uncharacterized protein with FMN-binding domain